MRALVYMGIMALVLALAVPAFAADTKTPPRPKDSVEFTGEMWMHSSHAEKLAFLLGVEMTLATEQYMSTRLQDVNKDEKRQKKLRQSEPSAFAKGWLKALGNTTRPELATKLDGYLETHPEARERHVFSIIWDQFIEPELKKARQERRGDKS